MQPNNPMDALEVAKLATLIGSELRAGDSRTSDTSLRGNRINPQQFINNVVTAAKPNLRQQMPQQFAPSSEEEMLLQHLNNAAMSQIPDVSQFSSNLNAPPAMIPMPTVPQQQAPQVYIPPTPIPQTIVPDIAHHQGPTIIADSTMVEISNTLKSIDSSIKALCDVFVIKAKKKKKRKVQQATKKPTLIQEAKLETVTQMETNHTEVEMTTNNQ